MITVSQGVGPPVALRWRRYPVSEEPTDKHVKHLLLRTAIFQCLMVKQLIVHPEFIPSRGEREKYDLFAFTGQHRIVTGVPKWLKQRWEYLRMLPPPTLEEVETSFQAAQRMRDRVMS